MDLPAGVRARLVAAADGDARVALNFLELAVADGDLNEQKVEEVVQRRHLYEPWQHENQV